jgi:hypothetical protein
MYDSIVVLCVVVNSANDGIARQEKRGHGQVMMKYKQGIE